MTCCLCADRGVIRIGYREEPVGWMDLGICRCWRGQRFRSPDAQAALAAKFDTDLEHVGFVEDLLDADDLVGIGAAVRPSDDLAQVGQAKRRGL